MSVIPLFKSQYSIGKSILTLQKAGESIKDGPDSIIDICLDNKLDSFFLIDDGMSGFLEGYVNSKESKVKMIFGLRLTICEDMETKNEESLNSCCKYIIIAKNTQGYKRLIKIYSKAATDGFYYVPRIDFKNLSEFWDDKDLQLVVPFYDSFIHRNYLEDSLCPPPPTKFKIDFIKEDNNLPFDDILSEKIDSYIKKTKSSKGFNIIKGQSIFYKNKRDFKAYLTFRAINERTTLGKPNLEHMASDEFCFESWMEKNNEKTS
jgi:DNA polymerase III alpha subunit